ncbi:MAG: GMC family oxidoreductase N-terminal domain-containing protein [Acidimicrobiales bacterium]
MPPSDAWDAIVVGAGVGGCVVAAGLAAAGRQVLLLEAGPGDPRPASVIGLDTIAAAEEPSRQWPDLRVRSSDPGFDAPGSSTASSDRPYRQGFGVGGGSLINSLLLTPGDSHDYRRWQQQFGCDRWGPDDMAVFLESAATAFGGLPHDVGPVSEAFAAAASAAGHQEGGSSLDQDRLGILGSRLAVRSGGRRSVVEAYLGPQHGFVSEDGGGLAVRGDSAVRRVTMAGHGVTGVEFGDGHQERAPLVIVSAGAIRSPLLLSDSGLTHPAIGQGLKDHPSFAFTIALNRDEVDETYDPASGARAISRLLRWSSDDSEHGDLQAFVVDRVDTSPDGRGSADGDSGPLAVVIVGLMRVTASGWVAPTAAESGARATGPTVVTGALSTASDRERLRSGVLHILDLLRSAELSSLVREIYLDDRGTTADALSGMDPSAIDRFLAEHPGPYAHPAGTCAMGPEGHPGSVVSCQPETAGQVIDTDGLYVADASIMPDLVQGGLQVPVAAIAERVAAGILALRS